MSIIYYILKLYECRTDVPSLSRVLGSSLLGVSVHPPTMGADPGIKIITDSTCNSCKLSKCSNSLAF